MLFRSLGLLVACQSTSSGVVTGTAVEIPGTSGVPTTAGSSTTTGSTSTSSVSSLQWTASDTDGVQTSSLKVPFDYNDPSKGEFDLFLARHLADPKQRIGSLLVNPGGPGFGGSDLAFSASNVYNKSLLDHFYPLDASRHAVEAGHAPELGDFLQGIYEAKVRKSPDRIQVLMTRDGLVSEIGRAHV